MKLRIQPIRSLFPAMICGLLCFAFLVIVPAAAFTADSLNISVGTNGDATAVFQFTLDGVIENAIPQSMLEDQLAKGLATSSSPPQIISFDKSEATLLLNGFATTTNVPDRDRIPDKYHGLFKSPDRFTKLCCEYRSYLQIFRRR